MSTIDGVADLNVKLPNIIHTTVAGIVLSHVTLISGIACYVIFDIFVFAPLTQPGVNFSEVLLHQVESLFSNPVNALWGALLMLIITEWLILVPTVFGGGGVGFTMQQLAEHRHLNLWTTAIAGSLIGLVVALAMDRWYSRVIEGYYTGYPIGMGVIGIAWGSLSSLLLLAWFKKKLR